MVNQKRFERSELELIERALLDERADTARINDMITEDGMTDRGAYAKNFETIGKITELVTKVRGMLV